MPISTPLGSVVVWDPAKDVSTDGAPSRSPPFRRPTLVRPERPRLLEQIRHRDVERVGELHQRAHAQVLASRFHALRVLHAEVQAPSELLLGQLTLPTQFGDASPDAPE